MYFIRFTMKEGIKGQITVFIIAALMIIVIIALFLIFMTNQGPDIFGNREVNPNSFLTTCLEEELKNVISIISEQGGYINPESNIMFQFDGEPYREIGYLCYSEFPQKTCTIQEGNLIGHLKDEIKDEIKDDIYSCFIDLGRTKTEEGYLVDASHTEGDFEIDLSRDKISFDIEGRITLTKSGQTSRIEDFKINFPTKLYDLAVTANNVLSDVAINNCAFDNLYYVTPKILVVPLEVTIDKDFISFYTITNKDTKERFRFAIKNCVG